MSQSTVLLVSEGQNVIDHVGQVAARTAGLRIEIVPRIGDVFSFGSRDDVVLLLIHVTDLSSKAGMSELVDVLRTITAEKRSLATVVLSDTQDPEQAATLLRMGVADCLFPPLDMQRLGFLMDILTVRSRRSDRFASAEAAIPVNAGESKSAEPGPFDIDVEPLFDEHEMPQVSRVLDQARQVAPLEATVLISGEAGTGKVQLARLIHELSPRRAHPFIVVDCAGIEPGQVESELFGHARGSSPAATSDRTGRFAEAGGGTLFLDGIETLSASLQAKLLRVIEDRVFEPIGASRQMPVRARLIAASHRSLEHEVDEGRFHSDLFYRLNVVGFHLHPLRERRVSIGRLANRFVAELAASQGREVFGISREAVRALEEHEWPGNVLELREVIRHAVRACQGREVRPLDLPENLTRPALVAASSSYAYRPSADGSSNSSLAQIKGQAELARIKEALHKHGNNRLRAAGELGISRMTLYKKLYKYGIMKH